MKQSLRAVLLFTCVSAMLASCVTPAQEKSDSKGGSRSKIIAVFHIDRQVENRYSVFSPGTYSIELKSDRQGKKYTEVLYTPDSNPDIVMDIDFTVTTEAVDGYEADPQMEPVEHTDDYAKIRVRYEDRRYSVVLPYYSEIPPEPYAGTKALSSRYLTEEITLITNVQQFLEKHAHTIWAGWDKWREDSIFVRLPDGSELAVSNTEKLPHRFRPIQGISLFGKRFFADESGYKKTEYGTWVLQWHGQASGMFSKRVITMDIVKVRRIDNDSDFTLTSSGNPEAGVDIFGKNQARRFFTYIHEAFHCEQGRLSAQEYEKIFSGKGPMPVRREIDPSVLSVDAAAYTALEEQFLAASYNEKDDGKALALFKKACAARSLKHAAFPAPEREYDKYKSRQEGTAVYAECIAALQKNDAESQAALKEKLQAITNISKPRTTQNYGDTYYTYGCYWSLLLDRFAPDWKTGFFEQLKYIDDIVQTLLPAGSAEEKEQIAALKQTAEYKTAFDQSRSIFEKRSAIINAFGKGGGIHYIVDFSKVKLHTININPHGSSFVIYGRTQYYPEGVEEFRFNSFVLHTESLAVKYDYSDRSARFIEWYDSRPDAPYTIGGTKNGSRYENLSVQADGISFTAALAEVTQTKDTVTITVLE